MGILVTKNNLQEVVSSIKDYVDDKSGAIEVQEWTTESNANDYTTSGVYQFAGWRKNAADNLPITNYAEDEVDRNNIAFTLIVNSKEGYLVRNDEGNVTRNIPTMIAQTLMLGNRRGSDTKIYTRHGQVDLSTNVTTWGEWKEVMTSTYLGVLDSYTGDLLNGATEIGLYTGAMVDLASNVADVFKLEVINNYAVTTQVSAATGTSVPNSVLQTITILNLDGSNSTKKRIGTYNGSGYTWGEWKENASATPDWNQNDETATDYIKNRTHYELLKDFKVLTDDEYSAIKLADNTFVADEVKGSVVLTASEAIQYDYSETECYELVSGVQNRNYTDTGGNYSNPTSTCRTLRINGKIVPLEWISYIDGGNNNQIHYSPDGERVFYGFGENIATTSNKYIVGNGIVIKDYAYWYVSDGGNTQPYLSYIIDTSVHGNGPYTIEFLFEREQSVKKLDEKFLPDSVKQTKYKRGDVVYYYTKYDGEPPHIGVMPFEDYERNPTSTENTRFPIGLVADPVKRTFVFTELINKNLFVNTSYILDYLAGYTSLDNGQETAKRLSTVESSVLNAYFPAFYDLRYNPKSNGSCFYTKQKDAYIPSLKEWEDVYSLCVGMYDASQMDKLICLKNGVTPAIGTYIATLKQFYGNTSSMGNSKYLRPFNLAGGDINSMDHALGCCPAFGIYTEEEENNYPEF